MLLLAWMPHECATFAFGPRHAARLRERLPSLEIRLAGDEGDFLKNLPDADVAAVWVFRREWLPLAGKMRVLATPAAGRDYFSVTLPEGVEKWHGSFHGGLMAETVLGMVLGCCRGILPSQTRRAAGDFWPRRSVGDAARRLFGARVTIVGFGRIGKECGRLLSLMGARIAGVSRRRPEPPDWFKDGDQTLPLAELDAWLPRTDHLVLVLPAGPDSDRLLDARRLALLPRGAFVHNVGRGNAIDEAALAKACREQALAGACLDVTQPEPPLADSPLLTADNIWLTPHTSAFAPEYMEWYADELAGRLQERFGL